MLNRDNQLTVATATKARKPLPKIKTLQNSKNLLERTGGVGYTGLPKMGCDVTQIAGCGQMSKNNCPNE